MLHIISTVVILLIAAGIYYRKNLKLHYKIMGAAFVLDVALVLYIEFTRHAVEQAINPVGALLMFHIIVSVLVLVAYLVQFELGRRILKGMVATKSLHIQIGITFVSLRLANYITSFMI
ncbi:MAG: hypothetical protein AAGA18_07260 [Verrucomicrobiota bacterium]